MRTVDDYLKSNRLKRASMAAEMICKELRVGMEDMAERSMDWSEAPTNGRPFKPIMLYFMRCGHCFIWPDFGKKVTLR